MALRPEPSSERRLAHLAALLTAAAGFVAFSVGKWGVFGVWGAVGGWYAWGWLPWLGVAVADLVRIRDRFGLPLRAATAAWVLLAHALWVMTVLRIY